MSTRIELRTAPEVKAVVLAAFPSYRKHAAYLSAFRPTNINSYWSGGTRDEFALVELATLRHRSLPTTTHPYFDVAARGLANASDSVLDVDRVGNITLKLLPPGFALVQAGIFCGKPATAHIYVHPSNMPKYLTEEN